MPTFRFFHQQTLERWMEDLIKQNPLAPVRTASVLTVWAQALIYSDLASTGDQQVSHRSLSYFEQARNLLNNEPGPAQLASVESRLATCLYLLSVSHINECRFIFGYTHTLVICMGLHRKTSSSRTNSLPVLELERRKRAFWSFYDIDCYLSVMLGQPRQLRDEDIDQEYPLNIEDHVLDKAPDLSMVPHHGNIEAFIVSRPSSWRRCHSTVESSCPYFKSVSHLLSRMFSKLLDCLRTQASCPRLPKEARDNAMLLWVPPSKETSSFRLLTLTTANNPSYY